MIIKEYVKNIETSYDEVDVIESPYSTKLLNGNKLLISFNFFNISNYSIKTKKQGFLGLKKLYILEVYETFYNMEMEASVKKTIIEAEDLKYIEDIVEKIKKLSKETVETDLKLENRKDKIIINKKIFEKLSKIISNADKILMKIPICDNFHLKTLSFKIEDYESQEEIIQFFKDEFNSVEFLDIEDIYIDDTKGYKELNIIYNSNLPFYEKI